MKVKAVFNVLLLIPNGVVYLSCWK